MLRATISDAKNRLSELLVRVQTGETLIILDRKTPVARVERITETSNNPHVLPAKKPWNPAEILDRRVVSGVEGTASLVDAVAEERETGW